MKVGDYVRTKDGRIFRWSNLCTTDIEDYMEHTRKILFIEDEIKSSPNIIDLIEVGDYVNGCSVLHKENNELVCGLLLRYKEENIQSVVTKEQFEAIKYEIK